MNERSVFLHAIEINEKSQQARYVEEACGDDGPLRSRVQTLLDAYCEAGAFLERAAVSPLQSSNCSVDESSDADEVFLKSLRPFLKEASRPDSIAALGHYQIETILGAGAFGTVVRAFDEKLSRVVAIKILHPEFARTSPPRKRFLREAKAAAAINHDHIIGIHAIHELPIPHIVMEYVSGKTIQQQLNESGPLETKEVVRLSLQIAAGLDAAHSEKIIHRDIKPANLMLSDCPAPRVSITDFGLARAVDDATMTRTGVIAGSPLYMSPEQVRGEPLDQRSDLFSLGSVMYQMVTGRPPFRGPSTLAILKRVAEDNPRPIEDIISNVPDWLRQIIFRLLTKSRSSRYQSAKEVIQALITQDSDSSINEVSTTPIRCPDSPSRTPQTEGLEPARNRSLIRTFISAAFVALAVTYALVSFVHFGLSHFGAAKSNLDNSLSQNQLVVDSYQNTGVPLRIISQPIQTDAAHYRRERDGVAYWCATEANRWASVTFRVQVPFSIEEVTNLPLLEDYFNPYHVPFLHIYNSHSDANLDPKASGRLEVSVDGEEWIKLYSSTPDGGIEEFNNLTDVVQGQKSFFLRGSLFVSENTLAGQFIRSRPGLQGDNHYLHNLSISGSRDLEKVVVVFEP